MAKKIYSTELKLEIVQRYLQENIGYKTLAQEYCIGSKADVHKWVLAYKAHGVAGLCTTHGTYTGDFEYSCAVTPPVRQTGNRLSRLTETACASLLA